MELSKVAILLSDRSCRAAHFIFFMDVNASCTMGTRSPLVNPHMDTRSTVLQYVGRALYFWLASVMNSLIWPPPQSGGMRTKK